MKKLFSLFLLIGFVVFSPLYVFASGDSYQGVSGTTMESTKQTGGGVVGKCDGKTKGASCQTTGAINPTCQEVSRGKLSCTATECESGYIHHIGYGMCRTEKWVQDYCARKTCPNNEISIPKIIQNPNKGKSGHSFKDCFCANKNTVIYDCGDGATGTPPKDNRTYTNLDDITVAKNTCKKTGSTFVGWRCGEQIVKAGEKFNISTKTTCVAQWEKKQYTVSYQSGDGNTEHQSFVDYNSVVDMPNYTNEYKKDGHIFKNWLCNNTKVDLNGSFTVTGDTTCIAQWEECPACNPGKGCTCELSVDNNECKYKTTPYENYRISSGNETAEPQCEQVTACPTGAYGTYPDCDCGNDKNYEQSTNTCIPKCGDGARWDGEGCVCEDKNRIYNEEGSKCKCMAVLHEDEHGNCVGIAPDEESEEDVEEETQQEQVSPQSMSYEQPPVMCQSDEKKVEGKCVKQCPSGATGKYPNCVCTGDYEEYDATQNKCVVDEVKQKQDAYDKARTNENSWANRGLTAVTTAATGIGAMELAQGLSEREADAAAEADMSAYIATMRCEYGNGHSVKFDAQKEIELPGGNSPTLSSYINEYKGLASKLKSIKAELGMKPGIEEEVILDKTNMGLYDDEFVGITEGGLEDEGSIYRATALGSKSDKEKIDAEKNKTSNRVKWGAVALAGGTAVGLVGDSLINGKLGEMVKNLKEKLSTSKDKEIMGSMLKETLKAYGMENTDKMDLSGLSISDYRELASKVNWESLKGKLSDQDGSKLDAKQLQELLLNNDANTNNE